VLFSKSFRPHVCSNSFFLWVRTAEEVNFSFLGCERKAIPPSLPLLVNLDKGIEVFPFGHGSFGCFLLILGRRKLLPSPTRQTEPSLSPQSIEAFPPFPSTTGASSPFFPLSREESSPPLADFSVILSCRMSRSPFFSVYDS